MGKLSRQSDTPLYARGFNLIEAAVVLGVIGLVIGGIWVGAAALNQSMRVNQLTSQILFLAARLQTDLGGTDATAICAAQGVDCSGSANSVDITALVVSKKLAPNDWVQGSGLRPLGHAAAISVFGDRFDIILDNFTSEECINLLMKIGNAGAAAGGAGAGTTAKTTLGYMATYYPYATRYWSTTSFPVTLATAQTACTPSQISRIFVTFGWTHA